MKKRRIIFLLLSVAFSRALFAIDGGINLDTAAYSTFTDLKFASQTKAVPWFSASFGEQSRMTISAQGSAYLLYTTTVNKLAYILDLDLFQFKHQFYAHDFVFNYAVGRIIEQDSTRLILNQSVDGARFNASNALGTLGIFVGYTGLLNANTQDVAVTGDDIKFLPTAAEPYALAAPKLVAKITTQFPELLGRSDLFADIIAEFDLRALTTPNYTETADMQFATVGFSGPIVSNLFYTVSATAELYQIKQKNALPRLHFAGLLSGELNYIFPSIQLWLFGKLQYSLLDFKPITNMRPSFLFSNMYSNMLMATVGVSKKFLPFLSGDIAVKAYIQTQESGNTYAGFQQIEGSVGLNVIIVHDAQFKLDAIIAGNNAGPKYYIRGKFALYL